MDKDWIPFHPNPSQPTFIPPAGAVDAHCHVFGPAAQFPYAPERKYTPCDASKDQLWALRDHLKFSRNVIVQATCHGADNSALVDALAHANDLARGIATVRGDVTDEELFRLHEAGVRGVRFNFVKRLVDALPFDELTAIAQRIAKLNWHIVIYFEASDLAEYFDFFSSLPTTVVVDHMGRPDLNKDINGAEFDLFLKLLDYNPNYWSKVTCPERISISGPDGYDDFVPFGRKVVETFPDRVLWGTDWPHPNMKSHMPDDGKLVNMIPRIAVTPALQHKLLVDNPMRLYWPEQVNAGVK
ncbi:amidohydrolase family protein [Paraglaciecola polaris]|uniref:2-pyrone-4,6-dicarboxylic acid hydrolase n=1 Tax=Paraglaciecola polaris LMG 21857 TaxID=1129793 RepID=K7AG02_9ALTE|nr:amidohydrolase family protein [Paraglaciecola polaris]GAC34210.1 2-pyrone-4,6-dicarboxylic acid hydrolase [Paraglaciecola polaris LMG 21857]|tara:strand:+ start:546 stop:1442 length:897 start_codon:yes stop_codon:yes gene_type:complete